MVLVHCELAPAKAVDLEQCDPLAWFPASSLHEVLRMGTLRAAGRLGLGQSADPAQPGDMLAIGLAAIETRLVEVYGLLAYPVRPNVTIAWPSGEAPGEHNEVIPRFPPVVQTIHRRRADRLVFAEVTAAPLPGGLPGLLGKPQFLEIPGDCLAVVLALGVFPDDSVGDGANVYEVVSGRDLEDALGIGHDDLEKSAMRAKEMGVISDFRIDPPAGRKRRRLWVRWLKRPDTLERGTRRKRKPRS
ncbi:MAG: hypothetical protein ACLQIB_16850 [Isosphaeraceae bacterium]